MDGTVLPQLPALVLHAKRDQVDPDKIVGDWLAGLQRCFAENEFHLAGLFIGDCWWRDILALDWDFTTKRGQHDIAKYLSGSGTGTNANNRLADIKVSTGGLKPLLLELPGMVCVQAGFTFKTRHGDGAGFVRLANVKDAEWKAWTVFTQLEDLDCLKDVEAHRTRSHAAQARMPQVNGVGSAEPPVLIVGASQAGVSLGARLRSMGIGARLVDSHGRVGDQWRARYKTVTLNTPTFTDHYPFMKYPDNWPRWLSRDPVADFMEHYAQLMGLDVQLRTTVKSIERSDQGQGPDDGYYRVQLEGPEGPLTVHAKHVVLATGTMSDEPVLPRFRGQELFDGRLYHSGQHRSAEEIPGLENKKVVVVGPGTSGHDVAQDFVNCGAGRVSMVQRHGIFSLSAEAWETLQLGLWNMDGLTTEEADLAGNSIPLAVARTMSIGLTRAMAEVDRDMVDGLRRAGLAVRTGEDGYGLADHQLITGGQYYIDQGANQMIIDGRIKIHRCEGGVAEFYAGGLVLADGTRLDADVVVLATGYEKNIVTVRRLMGDDVADRLEGFGDLDEEQERKGWWRPTGLPGFWYMTGSFLWCRQFSKALALQIAATIKGVRGD